MSERRDDTPDEDEPSRTEPKPRSYYYDDSTGYEIYDPAKDDEEDETEAGEEDDVVKS
jgi:hypothetical protein